SFKIIDFFIRLAADQDVWRGIVNAGDDFQVSSFFVDHDCRIGIQAADLKFSREQRRKLNVASSNQDRFNPAVLCCIESLLQDAEIREREERLRYDSDL